MPVIGFLDPTTPGARAYSTTRIPPGPEGDRLCRGRKRGYRVPLRRESKQPAAGAGGRAGAPASRRDRVVLKRRIRRQGGDVDDPDRLQHRRRSGPARSCHEPFPAERQSDRRQSCQCRTGGEAPGAPARAGADGQAGGRSRQSGRCRAGRVRVARRAHGCCSHGLANPGRSTPAPAARSTRPLHRSRASGPMRFSSPPIRFSPTRRIQLVHLATFHKIPDDLCGASHSRSWRADELRRQQRRTRFVRSASMSGASSRARSRRTCRSCRRTSSNWSSTPRPPGCWASPCRRRCSRAPTR